MKNIPDRIIRLAARPFLTALAMVGASPVFAVCNFNSGYGLQVHQLTVSPGNISLARDKTIGSVLASGEVAAVTGNYANCSGSNFWIYNVNAANGMTVAGLTNVFPTNIPGIGLRFYSRDNAGKSYRFVNQGTGGGYSSTGSWGWYNNGNGYWGVDVIVTGPVSSGVYNGNLAATFKLDTLNVLNVSVNPFTVTSSSCDASSTQQRVDLGTQTTNAFPAQGSTAGQKNFSIELRGCTATGLTSISYTLTAVGSTMGLPAGVLPNGEGGLAYTEGLASGVAVKIMDGLGNSVTFDSAKAVSYTPGAGSISIPFKAAMYRTSSSGVSPGLVRSQLVFTMNYK